MRKKFLVLLFLSLLTIFLGTSAVTAADTNVETLNDQNSGNLLSVSDNSSDSGELGFVPDQIVIQFTNDSSTNEQLQSQVYDRVSDQTGANIQIVDESKITEGLKLVEVTNYSDLNNIIKIFKEQPEILYADYNYIRTLKKTPNDTYYENIWGLNNTGGADNNGNTGKSGADIKAQQAWDITTGSNTVIVAVVDTGVDITHPDLAANIWTNPGEIPNNGIDDDNNGFIDDVNGWNFYNNNNDVSDANGHGTHCAGTIGAMGNNNLGVTGVAWNVKIMPIKLLAGKSTTSYMEAEAIKYATKMGASIISCSYGGLGFSEIEKSAYANSSALIICAAGNETRDNDITPSYPCSFGLSNIISVAATNNKDQLAWFSNYGKTSVDLAAPGEAILSTYPVALAPAGALPYKYLDGTSMATPCVSGVAALVKSANPSLTSIQIKNILLNSVDTLTSLKGKVSTGGRINAYKAVTNAQNSDIQPADLKVQSVDGPQTETMGTDIKITNTISNQGVGAAARSNMKFYLSTDTNITSSDIYLGMRAIPALAAGETSRQINTFTLPSDIAPGSYYIGAIADALDEVEESNENNDTGYDLTPMKLRSNSSTLGDAVGNTNLKWTTGGDATWFWQSVSTYAGGDAAQSGDLGNEESTWIQTTVNGPGLLNFLWKVSSEDDADLLNFYVDGELMDSISGDVAWKENIYNLKSGSHVLRWEYAKDFLESDGLDCGWLDRVRWTQTSAKPDLIVRSVDAPTSTGPGSFIKVASTVTNQGAVAAGTSILRFYLSADKTITSSDLLLGERRVPVLGALKSSSERTTLEIPSNLAPGTYYLGVIADALKQIPESNENNGVKYDLIPLKVASANNSLRDAVGNNELLWTTGGDATWFRETTNSYAGGDAAQSGVIGNEESTWIQTAVTGSGKISFLWKTSSEANFDTLNFYVDGVLMDSISGNTAWAEKSYDLGTGEHTLRWEYSKDVTGSLGSDCGMLDRVRWAQSSEAELEALR